MRTKSIKGKILLPVYIMGGFFLLSIVFILLLVKNNLNMVREMDSVHFETVKKADGLKLSIVQVQQWLTDISATRAAEGYDDGLEEAAAYAEKVSSLLEELKALNPESTKTLDEIKDSFTPYYETGKQMANAYIEYGPEGGNAMMSQFDGVAEDINTRVDEFVDQSDDNIDGAIRKVEGSIVVIILLAILAVIAAILISVVSLINIERNIMKPMAEIRKTANELSRGNLKTELLYHSNDEMGQLSEDMRDTIRNLDRYVSDIGYVMKELGSGNLTAKLTADFKGDFVNLKESIILFVSVLRGTLSQINDSSNQVAAGSAQVSDESQSLARGASEQASSVEELSSSISSVSDEIKTNARTAGEANEKAEKVGLEAQNSNQQMSRMVEAMNEINESSNKISQIIKTIEDIAFQTNILALNASVEAARAGEAGKGFAVVAGEVRNLASKSAEAASNTAALIESSIKAVENGAKIADDTAKSLSTVTQGIQDVAGVMGEISQASGRQAATVEDIAAGVRQISQLVTTVSATSEQSQAASEELSAQAQVLKEYVGRFKMEEGSSQPVNSPSPLFPVEKAGKY